MITINVILKDGGVIKWKIENLELKIMAEGFGDVWFDLGKPLDLKKKVLMSRNKYPAIILEFVNAWKKEDIDKVAKMTTDEEMAVDMITDYRLQGHEVVRESN